MAKRPCQVCGQLSDASNCPAHRRRYNNRERIRRAHAVAAHRAQHGDWCPGWQVPPHHSADLTADHIVAVAVSGVETGPLQVLCRSCNSRKREFA